MVLLGFDRFAHRRCHESIFPTCENMRIVALLLLALLSSCQTAPPSPPAADVVLQDTHIYTGNADQPWADAIAIRGGVIVAVGTVADMTIFKGDRTDVKSLPGKLVMPAFHDAHVHPLGAGRQEQGCSLAGLATVAAIIDKVRDCAVTPGNGWIVGRGWNLSLFPQANPNKAVLDAVVADRPLYLRGEDGHSAWLNSKGLAVAGITKDTKDPPQGVVERDKNGEPSGTLRENAIDLVSPHLPKRTLDDDVEALRFAQRQLHAHGIVSIMDAGLEERTLETYQVLDKDNSLKLRVVGCTVVEPNNAVAALQLAQQFRTRFTSASVHPTCAKIYLDGVLEGETAALLADYDDNHGHKGGMNATQQQLNDTVAALDADGFSVHMHVIGDAAVRAALDAYTFAQAKTSHRLKHTLAHVQLVDAVDVARFAAIGVTVNAQSYWAYPDNYIVEVNTPQVGQQRVDRMYPWGEFVAAGATIVGGSDWPVSTVNPLLAIEVMVRRADPSKPNDAPSLGAASQRLTLPTAIAAYTTTAATFLEHDNIVGMLKPGMRADLVALDRDIFVGDATAISDAQVWATWMDGVIVYQAP
jgi:predicted amidohydrolase YtcJ